MGESAQLEKVFLHRKEALFLLEYLDDIKTAA